MDLGILGRLVVEEVDGSLHVLHPSGVAIRVALVTNFIGDPGIDEHCIVTVTGPVAPGRAGTRPSWSCGVRVSAPGQSRRVKEAGP